MHLGLEHLPTFLGKVSDCTEKLLSCVRPGRCWGNAKGSICSVQVIGFVRCWSPTFAICGTSVVMAFLCWCQGLAWLHHVLQLPVCWTSRAETKSSTVKSVPSCASAAQPSPADRAMPLWAQLLLYFLLTIKIFPLYFSSNLRHS